MPQMHCFCLGIQVLVKKICGDSNKRARKRRFKLEHLVKENDIETASNDRLDCKENLDIRQPNCFKLIILLKQKFHFL